MSFVRTNVQDLIDAAADLRKLSGGALQDISREAVNEVAEATYRFARRDMNRTINLTDAYIASKVTLDLAKPGRNPTAVITTKGDLTPLSRFGVTVRTAPVNWSNERILAMGKRFGKWPGWTQRVGRPVHGVQPNQKMVGVTVEIKRGQPQRFKRVYFAPLKRGQSQDGTNGYGLFRPEGVGKDPHLYGPAPYALFRQTLNEYQQTWADDLSATVGQYLFRAAKVIER